MILSSTKLEFPQILKQNMIYYILTKCCLLITVMLTKSKTMSATVTYQPWNQKFGYFFYLLNPSVGTKTDFGSYQLKHFAFHCIKAKQCARNMKLYHSATHFMFLSEVQHISTCSNNVCPYVNGKNLLHHLLSLFHPSLVNQ